MKIDLLYTTCGLLLVQNLIVALHHYVLFFDHVLSLIHYLKKFKNMSL